MTNVQRESEKERERKKKKESFLWESPDIKQIGIQEAYTLLITVCLSQAM